MTNPTSNFGWQMPTSTDLVTDLPADFETFGQAVDTSLADLKGGTTGQVLSKASNTDMDFTWVAQDDSNAIQNAIVDAKGDLIAASAADTPARLAVGNNGETIVADSSTSTGLRYQATYEAGKNLLINGLLDIWQRSTSVTGQANGYATVDRWYLTSSASCTFAQETTTIPAGCRYSQKVTVGASAASTAAYQAVETLNTMAYVGQNITFSARFQSSATPSISLIVEYSTTVDQPLAQAGWTAITATSGGTGTAGSASFTTISGVYAIPSNAKSLRFSFTTVGTMASGAILYYGGFQAELGVVVTSLVRNGATIQGELAACQRYYYRSTTTNTYGRLTGYTPAASTTGVYLTVQPPVKPRVSITAVDYSNIALYDGTNVVATISSISLGDASNDVNTVNVVCTGLTQFRPYALLANNNVNGYIGFSAEL